MKLRARHLFIPHTDTHAKAHLLHWHSLFIYGLLFMLMQFSFNLINIYKPGVLGVNSNITVQEIVDKVNVERKRVGLPPVRENSMLNQAATAKAHNMFEEDYWAHFSPSGKDPWGFITGSGYKFSYAGENLARNFYTSDEVVNAWMNSPTHRANILNPNYQEVGIAVEDGVLQGQKTTLIVQEFGRPIDTLADAPKIDLGGQTITLDPSELDQGEPLFVAGVGNVQPAVADPYKITRMAGMSLIGVIGLLLVIDMIVLKRRGVFRFTSHHFAHLLLLIVAGTALAVAGVGSVL